MKNLVALLTLSLVLASGSPALAQSTGGLGSILNDALGGLLSGRPGSDARTWQGHLVQAKGTTMIFRAEDGKVYAVDMSAIDRQAWHSIGLGQAMTLAASPGPAPQTLVAARIESEQPDRAGQLRDKRAFRSVHGVVERVEGSEVTVRSADGTALPVDVARITGEAEFRVHDGAVVILEPGPANTVVWIEREDRTGGRRGDILSGLSAEYRRLHGDRVYASGTTMIFRADDGKTYAVDMSALDTRTWQPIEPGQAVTLAAKPGHEPAALIGARLRADPADRPTGHAPKKPVFSAQGTVEAVQEGRIRFRTTDGKILWADALQMPGRAAARVNDQGTLVYERGPQQQIAALWLERQEAQPSAAVNPRVAGPGEYQRVRGYVQSVSGYTIALKADDGRTLTVDASQVDAQARSAVRQGDLISVVGKTTARADQFVAEVIEREARR